MVLLTVIVSGLISTRGIMYGVKRFLIQFSRVKTSWVDDLLDVWFPRIIPLPQTFGLLIIFQFLGCSTIRLIYSELYCC